MPLDNIGCDSCITPAHTIEIFARFVNGIRCASVGYKPAEQPIKMLCFPFRDVRTHIALIGEVSNCLGRLVTLCFA